MKGSETLQELFFFYDPQVKKLICTNRPWESFFGSPAPSHEEFPFSNTSNPGPDITTHWQKCLTLKEKQSHQFEYTANTGQEQPGSYQFTVTGTPMESIPGQPCWLFGQVRRLVPVAETGRQELATPEQARSGLTPLRGEYEEFIDLAVHDLDAPLRKLSVLIDSALRKLEAGKKEELQDTVQRVHKCLGDMRSLIDGMALLARTGPGAGDISEFDTGKLLDEVLSELRPVAEKANARIHRGELPVIKGNRAQYFQLFKCLLENALRFTRADSRPEIMIGPLDPGMLPADAGKDNLAIHISDNGIGFEPGEAEKIFRPLVRLHGKSEFPGNGIGLALCRKIMENHGGSIYAETREEGGTRFVLLIPQTH